MHDYFFQGDVVRLALVIGVIVSMLFYERFQLTSGGAIVPAYLALFLPAPLQVVTTILAGYLTYLIVSVLLARRVILYGRRKFEVELLVGLAFISIGATAAANLADQNTALLGLAGIGFVVPGVIAHDMSRQRPRRTLLALLITTVIMVALIYVYVALATIAPLERTPTPLESFGGTTAYPVALLLPGVIVGVLVAIAIHALLGVRSGGFVTGAYLALVIDQPLDLLFVAACALVTYVIVVHGLMPRLLIFGRRKLSTMVIVASVVAWTAEVVITSVTGGAYHPWQGFTVVAIMLPALLANDSQRQGLERTAWGAAIVALAVFGAMNLLAAGLTALGYAV